jgi:TonB-dependent receptor
VGVVRDAAGQTLPGFTVEIVDPPRRVVTSRTGRFRIPAVSAGRRTVSISGLGFATQEIEVVVTAGQVASIDVVMQIEAVELEGILIRGQRSEQARALNQQKTADNIVEVVSAENMDRFPDINSAEAVQRLTSVSVSRDQGEGRYVLVRGSEPRLSAPKINGIEVPAPEGNIRYVALDVIPADVLSGIELSRTLTSDMDADAIGGSVNLRTRIPEPGLLVNATAAGGYNQLVEEGNFQFAGTFGTRFGENDRFGLLLGGSYYQTDRGSDDLEQSFDSDDFGSGDVTLIDELELRAYNIRRERLGLTGVFDFLVNPRNRLYVNGLYNDFSDQEYRSRTVQAFGAGDYTSPTTVEGAEIESEMKDRLETQTIATVTLGGDHSLGGLQLNWYGSYGYAEEDEPNRQDTNFITEGVNFLVDRSDPENPVFTNTNPGDVDPFDASVYEFDEQVIENNLTKDENWIGAADLSIPYSLSGGFGEVKLGGKYRTKQKSRDNSIDVYGFDGDYFLSEVQNTDGPRDGEFYFGRYELGPTPDAEKTRAFFEQNRASFEIDDEDSVIDSSEEDFDAEEDVIAGYLMTTFDIGRWRVIPGLRFETTDLTYSGNVIELNEDGDLTDVRPVSASNDYSDVLPNLNVRYQLAPNANLRAAVTRSLARPNHFDIVPHAVVNREDDEVELGNADLVATRSWNYDLLLDYYIGPLGVITAGFFYKDLTDYIFTNRFDIESGDLAGFEAVQPQNAGDGYLLGGEVGIQYQFTSAPGFWSGFGVGGNLMLADSDATIPGREEEDVRLPGQMNFTGNAALFYENYGFGFRLVLNYFDDFLDEVGEDPDEDIFVRHHTQLDLSASYTIQNRWTIFLEMVNLTDEPWYLYEGSTDRPIQQEYYSWWGHLGLKFNL